MICRADTDLLLKKGISIRLRSEIELCSWWNNKKSGLWKRFSKSWIKAIKWADCVLRQASPFWYVEDTVYLTLNIFSQERLFMVNPLTFNQQKESQLVINVHSTAIKCINKRDPCRTFKNDFSQHRKSQPFWRFYRALCQEWPYFCFN